MVDVIEFFKTINDFANNDTDAQALLSAVEFSANVDMGNKKCSVVITGGNSIFAEGLKNKVDFTLYVNENIMEKLALGDLDPGKAFLSGDLEVAGDFEKNIGLLEIFDLYYEKKRIKRDVLRGGSARAHQCIRSHQAGG